MERSAKEKVFNRDFDAALIAESKGDYYAMRVWLLRAETWKFAYPLTQAEARVHARAFDF